MTSSSLSLSGWHHTASNTTTMLFRETTFGMASSSQVTLSRNSSSGGLTGKFTHSVMCESSMNGDHVGSGRGGSQAKLSKNCLSATAITTSTPTKYKSTMVSASTSSSSSHHSSSTHSSNRSSGGYGGLEKRRKVIELANELLRTCRSLGFEFERGEIVAVREINANLFVFFYESILGIPLESKSKN